MVLNAGCNDCARGDGCRFGDSVEDLPGTAHGLRVVITPMIIITDDLGNLLR